MIVRHLTSKDCSLIHYYALKTLTFYKVM